MAKAAKTGRIAFFLPNLAGGGAERVALNLLKGMVKRGLQLDLVLASAYGPYLEDLPKEVRVVDLGMKHTRHAVLPLARYLRHKRPAVLLSHLSRANVAATLARMVARVGTPLILVEHNTPSVEKQHSPFPVKVLGRLKKWLYPHATMLIAVSNGAAGDLEADLGLAPGSVRTVYNPVVDDNLAAMAAAPADHPWFSDASVPVFISVGRLCRQKDQATLLKAFARLRERHLARLMILGEGPLRLELEELAAWLGIGEDLSLTGFVDNPYAFMSQAAGLVLSSIYEGLPTVLVEAMACGCPVVSTDCPSGPAEILDNGKYGQLVPVGDEQALAGAMANILDHPPARETIIRRAQDFTVDRAVSKYLRLIEATILDSHTCT